MAAFGVKDVVEVGDDDAVEKLTGAELQASRMKAAIFAHWPAPHSLLLKVFRII